MRVDVLVLDGAMGSSVAITLDALDVANRLRAARGGKPAFSVALVGSGARAARRFLAPHLAARGEGEADLVIMPGLGMASEAAIAARLARRDAVAAMRLLEAAARRGAEIATSCSGAFLLGRTGLLAGRRVTTTWCLAPLFKRLYPQARLDTDALVLRDGPITTAGAAMAQMDLMLSLIARHGGPGLANACARYLLLDKRGSQSRYMALGFLAAADPRIAKAEKWARAQLTKGFSMDDFAAAAAMSPRTFARRLHQTTGLSPIRFVQRLRMETALELIETTRLPIEEVARRVGYAEPSTLRRVLRRDAGRAPRALRTAG